MFLFPASTIWPSAAPYPHLLQKGLILQSGVEDIQLGPLGVVKPRLQVALELAPLQCQHAAQLFGADMHHPIRLLPFTVEI